jgi:chromosomal replication initiation ATPase DnaA
MGEVNQPTTIEDRAKQTYVVTPYDLIFKAIRKEMKVSKEEIMSKKRDRKLVEARQMFCLLARRHTHESSVEIGKIINRDHATVLYSVSTMDSLISFTKRLAIAKSYIEMDLVPQLGKVEEVKICECCKQPILNE